MLARSVVAGVLLAMAAPIGAEPAAFERRVVAILNAGGTADAVQARLNRVGADPSLTLDQRVAIDAMRTLVRSRTKPKGLSLAEAEAFAARNPTSPASAMLIAEAALAGDLPQRSADALIAAARGGGALVDFISPTTVSRLIDKLDGQSEKARTQEVAKSLVESGWSRGSANLRSFLAMEVIRAAIASARIEEARRALPAVAQPSALHAILIDNRLAPLRSDVDAMAGPRLERHWRSYLTKARDEWLASGSYLSATAYAAALRQAGYHQAFVDTFLPRFMRGYNCPTDQVSRSLAQDIAESLVILGRWTKADDVMARAGGVSVGAYAGILLERGEFGRAASYFDRALKSAEPPANEQDEKARAWLVAVRDCALYRDRNVKAAITPNPKLLDVAARLRLALCLDKTDDARTMLIAALEDEEERAAALKWVQPYLEPPTVSDFHKEMASRIRALQRDPAVVQATLRHGVILDWTLESSAPPQSEFQGLPVRRASPCNSGWVDDPMEATKQPENLYEKKPAI